jgi:hypothetical protein
MRQAFAHDAVVEMDPDADPRAPGAAITVALCGHWDHQPPCPLAPHHTRADRDGDRVRLRILFVTERDAEPLVRQCIEQALTSGELTGPDSVVTRWRLDASGPGEVAADEADHAARLARS